MTIHGNNTSSVSRVITTVPTPPKIDLDSLQGLIILKEAGLIRHDNNVKEYYDEAENQEDHDDETYFFLAKRTCKFDGNGRLIYLDLGGCRLHRGFPNNDSVTVLSAFGKFTALQTLNLGGTDLPIKDTLAVLDLLSNSPLEELHLGGNGIGDKDVFEFQRHFVPLKTLDLRYNNITRLTLPEDENIALIKLYLEGNQLQDEGAEALATWLQQPNNTLQEIFLGANSIGSKGAKALAQCLKTNKTLTKIYLEGNKIGPDGGEAFTKVLLDCKGETGLQHLFVDNNGIGKDGSKRLASALNSATVIGDSLMEG